MHPIIVDIYKENKIERYSAMLETFEINEENKALMPVEKLLLKILEKN